MDSKKWLEQKQDREHRQGLPSLAADDEISKNLKRFASQRPNLAGEGDVEKGKDVADVANGGGEQTQGTNVIWHGQSNNLTRTHANVAMMQNQQKQNQLDAEKA